MNLKSFAKASRQMLNRNASKEEVLNAMERSFQARGAARLSGRK